MTKNEEFKHLFVTIITTFEIAGVINNKQATQMAISIGKVLEESKQKELTVYEYLETIK